MNEVDEFERGMRQKREGGRAFGGANDGRDDINKRGDSIRKCSQFFIAPNRMRVPINSVCYF